MKVINFNWRNIVARILAITYIILVLSACDSPEESSETTTTENGGTTFVAISNISGVPMSATSGTPLTLNGTVTPSNATNQTIVWSVSNAGTTGANITGNTLNTEGAGTAIVTATVANGKAQGTAYTQNFIITVSEVGNTFIAVTGITGVPTSATVGTSLTLSGTVSPSNATNKTIDWSVVSGPATVSGNTLNPTGVGTVSLLATVVNGTAQDTNYTQNFSVTISGSGNNFVAVSGITGVPVSATVGIPLTLNGTVSPSNATNKDISWTVSNAGTTGANISGNTLNTTGAGSVTITATVANGIAEGTAYTQNFNITVNTTFVAVSNITGVPTSATAGTPLTLNGIVTPSNATNQTIVWSVSNAGTTGASITSGNILNTTNAGTVTVRATIANGTAPDVAYTQDFTVTVFVAVTDITGIPSSAIAGMPLTLSGTVSPSDATNQTIIWTVSNAGTTGATISGNVLNTANTGTVTVKATITNGTVPGIAYTQNFTITIQQSESFTITFTQITDEAPEIIGPTIYRSGTNGQRTATIELANPGQYSSINWYITGTTVSGIGSSITLSAANILYNNAGQHFLTVEVEKNGVPYNRTIIFTVAP